MTAQHILLGISGGIAAYKTPQLVRDCQQLGAEVRVVMTSSAHQFVTPMALQAVSGHPVLTEQFDLHQESVMSHIELARWADKVLLAPATADLMARLAHGHANDLLTALCLATKAPLYIAPAMNTCMWQHPLTQNNITTLVGIGATLLGPDAGLLACGEVGEGRMLDTADLAQQVLGGASKHHLQGKTLVITAGPTREAIDPVRYMSNHSSGKMGYAMAAAAVKAGANVILISGPTGLATPPGVLRIDVESAQQMLTAVLQHMSHCDVFIGAAAVCDYGVAQPSLQKLKKDQAHFEIKWQQTPDIIQQVAQLSNKPFVVGFASETDNVLVHAKSKLQRKQLDMIIANDVSDGQVFGRDHNEVTVLDAAGKQTILPRQTKAELAVVLIEVMVDSMTVMV